MAKCGDGGCYWQTPFFKAHAHGLVEDEFMRRRARGDFPRYDGFCVMFNKPVPVYGDDSCDNYKYKEGGIPPVLD